MSQLVVHFSYERLLKGVGASRMSVETADLPQLVTIEWHMMDKSKFFPLSMISSFGVRCLLYPLTVIKTRIQIQKHKALYSGTYDAFRKTLHFEGVAGLYKGFWVNTIQIVSSMFYITTYESVRHLMASQGIESSKLKALVGGGMASMVGQTIIVPFDVVSQHMMVLGQLESGSARQRRVVNPLNIDCSSRSKLDIFSAITREIYRQDGLRGFYRGYCASLCAFVPNGALWWSFYLFYSEQLTGVSPFVQVPQMVIQCVAAPLSGISASVITNPLDIVRARFQVQRLNSYFGTFYHLWQEEHFGIFTKGLTARLTQSIIFSFFGILGYETIKRLSVHEEYKQEVRW